MKNEKRSTAAELAPQRICGDLSFAASEAYKLLRTNIQFSFPGNDGCKVIGITSSKRGEGKSTTAINLAYSFACDGKKVLLLESDLRLPNIAKRLKLRERPGLSDYLVGTIKGNEGLQRSEIAKGTYVVTAGLIPPNPSELLGSASMESWITAFKEVFDYIIIDLPPVNIVSDPLVVSKFIDGYAFVVRKEYSTRQDVLSAMEKMSVVGAKVLGFVFNSCDEDSPFSGLTDKQGKKYGKYGKYARYGYDKSGYGKSAHEVEDIVLPK